MRQKVQTNTSSRMLDDMKVQCFYDAVEHNMDKPVWIHDKKDILADLQTLSSLHETGLLKKYPPLPVWSSDGKMSLTSKQREDRMYHIIACMIPNQEHKDLAIIENDLKMGNISIYEKECRYDMGNMDKTENEIVEKSDFMARVKMRMEKDIPFSAMDVQYLNDAIQRKVESIENTYVLAQSSAYAISSVADVSERRRNEERVDKLMELPAYLSSEIGTEMPDDLRKQSDDILAKGKDTYDTSMEELYADVYSLERYSSRIGSDFLSDTTRDILGDGYKAYSDNQFENTLQRLREEHVKPKLNGLSGIDLTQSKVSQNTTKSIDKVSQMKETEKQQTVKDTSINAKSLALKSESSVVIEDNTKKDLIPSLDGDF